MSACKTDDQILGHTTCSSSSRSSDDNTDYVESQAELFCTLPAVAVGVEIASELSGSSSLTASRQGSLTDSGDLPTPEAGECRRYSKQIKAFETKLTSSKEQFSQTDLESNKVIVPKKKKKKRHKRRITICVTNCKYDVVRRMALKFGMSEVSEEEPWDLYWTDMAVAVERAREMKRFQKINHFPGMSEISRKDLLARNLNRMLKISSKEYNFFPKTWCLPADCHDLLAHARLHKNCTYICKPETGSQGRGIFLAKAIKDVKLAEHMICQLYISRPFLIDGYKFDLRIYTLITSCDPLRVYIYKEGLARFATSRYQEPTLVNISNVYMHLTNYSVNKHSRTYVVDDEAGSKRKISSINKWLEDKGYNVPELWSHIDEVVMKTVIAAQPMLKHSYHTYFPSHEDTFCCFELLGFDIMLDHKLKPYLLEVNHSPSYHTETPIDLEVKESLVTDTFRMLNLQKTNKQKVLEEERRRTQERLLQGGFHKDSRGSIGDVILSREQSEMQATWELENMGNYRCVYPPQDGVDKYLKFFQQNASSVYQETAASRARDECTRLLREELETKTRFEATKRVGTKLPDVEKLRSESPGCHENCRPRASHAFNKKLLGRKESTRADCTIPVSSFSPEPIWECEEQDRLAALHQREMLVHSQGILSVVKEVLQRSEKSRRDHAMLCRYLTNHAEPIKLPTLQTAPITVQANATDKQSGDASTLIICPAVKGLTLQCSNAPITSRPSLQQAPWTAKHEWRSTKAHNARAHTNNIKLRELYKRQSSHIP